jgi:guanidinopropionase
MDEQKLKALRDKYTNMKASEEFGEKFKHVADVLFSDGDTRTKPYSGISTFLDLPISDTAEGLDIALIGVPMDLGVTNRPGARFGPRAVRSIERIGPFHHVHNIAPHGLCKAADIGDVPMRSRYSLDMSTDDIEDFYRRVVATGARPLSIGGDHSVTYPILKAVAEKEPVALVHIDAHCDTSGEFDESKFHHGAPFRNATLDGLIDPQHTIQIGIRGSAEFLWQFSYDAGMTVIHAEEFAKMGVEAVIAKTREVVGDLPVYVTFDVDALDPAFAPGTGTPEVGGLSSLEALTLLQGLKGLPVIGGDVVEVAPQYDANTTTAHVGAQLLFEIFCLMALSVDG